MTEPTSWKRNPSSWSERAPVIVSALFGLGIASYLALYQLGIVRQVWEPFFGDGSQRVLHSALSRWLPVPDAVLGALGYAAEVILSVTGGEDRWRTMPWLVVSFGALTAAMAAVGIILVICQPVLAHAWCTLCLLSALISVLLLGLVMREAMASWHHLKHRKPFDSSHGLRPGTT